MYLYEMVKTILMPKHLSLSLPTLPQFLDATCWAAGYKAEYFQDEDIDGKARHDGMMAVLNDANWCSPAAVLMPHAAAAPH